MHTYIYIYNAHIHIQKDKNFTDIKDCNTQLLKIYSTFY